MVTKLLRGTSAIMILVRLRLAWYLYAFTVLATCQSLLAQGGRYEGRIIANIVFEPKEQPVAGSELAQMLPLKRGTPFRMADVRGAIERLFATGRYQDIQVEAEPYGKDVILHFLTTNSWFVGHVSVAGDLSDPPNRGQLANAARLELGEPFTDEKLDEAKEGVKGLLENNGLFESTIEPEYDYDPLAQQVHIRFIVNAGRRARYTDPDLRGDLKLPRKLVVKSLKWRQWVIGSWKSTTQSRTRQGLDSVRNRYQREKRLEAKVGLDSMQYERDTNRAKATIDINAGPKIDVRTVGAKLSTKNLQQYVPIYEEHTVDYDLLVEGQRNLIDYYQARGFFEAEVEFKQQRVSNDTASIDYIVNTGRRHRLVRVEINGNKYFTRDAIRERMFLTPASLLQFRHGRYSGAFLRRDEDSIANLYKSNGFRDVVVTSKVEDDYRGKRGDVAVFIAITEGPQWFVSKLEIEGIKILDRDLIISMLSSVEGQPFSEFNVAVDRDTILAQYFTNGFPNAIFEWSSRPAAQLNHVDLKFVINEGRQQFVREVLINGLKVTRPSLVNRNILLNPGDPLSPNRMTDTQHRLYDLGMFAKVDTAIQNPEGDTSQKYVVYDMEEARRYSMAVGFGAEIAKIGGCQQCLESPGGQAGFAPRVSFDISRLNMWGLGHTVSFRTRASTLDRRALLDYSAPRFRNREGLNFSFTGLYDDSRDVRTFNAKRLEGSAQLSQRWSKATTVFYRYTYRRVSVDPGSLKISPLLIPLLSQPVRVGVLSGGMIQDRRDDPVDSHKGIYNTIDIGLAEHAVGSQRNFFRFLGRNASYKQLTRKYVLARNTSFGVLHPFNVSVDPLQAIPLAERFFGGGGTSQRGFPDFQAGPRDDITGFPLGGTALLFNQTELRFPLIGDNIGGVFFHDAGNIYTRVSDISFRVKQRDLKDFDYMGHAVGFGVRYRTPIGPVRLDLAYSINPPRFFGFKGTQDDLLNAGINPCQTAPGKCVEQGISHFQFFFSIGQTF